MRPKTFGLTDLKYTLCRGQLGLVYRNRNGRGIEMDVSALAMQKRVPSVWHPNPSEPGLVLTTEQTRVHTLATDKKNAKVFGIFHNKQCG